MYKLALKGSIDIEKTNDSKEYKEDKTYNKELFDKVYTEIDTMVKEVLKRKSLKPEDLICISGLERGAGEIFAIYAMNHNLPIQLSIHNWIDWNRDYAPIKGNSPVQAQAYQYQQILDYTNKRIKEGCINSKIEEIQDNYKSNSTTPKVFKTGYYAKNQHLIDNCDGLISYMKHFSSGTHTTIENAKEDEKYIGNVNEFNNLVNLLAPFKIMYNTDLLKENSHILIQGCNCFNTMGAGIAKILKDKYPEVYKADCDTKSGDREKLGSFTVANINPEKIKGQHSYVVNAYTQYTYHDKKDMFYNEAFYSSITGAIDYFIEKRGKGKGKIIFSLPAIGLGLANGKIEEVYEILNNISDKYISENIEIKLCLIEFDKDLNRDFAKLEKEKYYPQKQINKKKSKEIKNEQ